MKLNLGGHPFYEFRFTEIILQEYSLNELKLK